MHVVVHWNSLLLLRKVLRSGLLVTKVRKRVWSQWAMRHPLRTVVGQVLDAHKKCDARKKLLRTSTGRRATHVTKERSSSNKNLRTAHGPRQAECRQAPHESARQQKQAWRVLCGCHECAQRRVYWAWYVFGAVLLTTVKKHKADLIHKAKVKKAYYKMREREAPENSNGHENTQDLGRFAPQNEPDDEAVPSTPRHEPSVSRDKPKKLPYFYRPPKAPKNEPAPPKRTREEALEERAVRRDMWNRKSPSRLGRQRGQPDLGARVAVMLEKIQKST